MPPREREHYYGYYTVCTQENPCSDVSAQGHDGLHDGLPDGLALRAVVLPLVAALEIQDYVAVELWARCFSGQLRLRILKLSPPRYFYDTWKTYRKDLAIRKADGRFAIAGCAHCDKIFAGIRICQRNGNHQKAKEWKKLYAIHERYHKGHRLAVALMIHEYSRGRLTELGTQCILIHVDSMEQQKFKAIYKCSEKLNKELRNLRGPDFRITVAAVRGPGIKRNYVFIVESWSLKGPNVTIQVVTETLKELEKDGLLNGIGQLDLLLDNTNSENKCSAVRRPA